MRPGLLLSIATHVLIAFLTAVTWPINARERREDGGVVVPIDVVDIGEVSNVRGVSPINPETEAAASDVEGGPPPPDETVEAAPDARRTQSIDYGAVRRELLANKAKENAQTQTGDGAPGETSRSSAGLGTAQIAALEDRIRAVTRQHIRRNACWRTPVDQPDFERLVVTIRLRLDARGALIGEPQVVSPRSTLGDPILRAAVDSARRAVQQCSPFPFAGDPALAPHYDLWRDMEYTFDPQV
jgi:hypothetical protein